MATYVVRVNQSLIYEVEVEANDEDQAVEAAWAEVEKNDLTPVVDNSRLESAIRQVPVCDVFKYGQCDQCDHPCSDYFDNHGY
jgi:hypothetical protein